MMTLIPRTFHRIWVGSEQPAEFREYGVGWRALHPGWKHVLWTDTAQPHESGVTVRPIPRLRVNQWIYDHADTIAPRYVGQLRADLLRYEILWNEGGVYIDADFEALRPIDELLDGVDCFAAWEADGRWVNNAIMGAVHYHEFIGRVIDGIAANVEARRGQRPNRLTGPQYITPLVRSAPRGSVTVFPQRDFYPYLWDELHRAGEVFPDAYAVHHWNNARRRKRVAA